MSGLGPAACWLAHKRIESWSRLAKERVGAVRKSAEKGDATTSATSMSISTESTNDSIASSNDDSNSLVHGAPPHAMPSSSSHSANTPLDISQSALHSPLQHQSKSFPPRLQRTPSISSQSSIDSTPTRQSGHRGSSPQIRAFGPDGRSATTNDSPISHFSRSSSPLRAISLDARCSSPACIDSNEPSSLPNNLTSHSSSVNISSAASKAGRCLSPLLIPPRAAAVTDAGAPGPASPLGALQPDLYQRPEGPVYVTAPASSITVGKIHLSIKYDSHLFDLAVHLMEAHDLCPIEDGGLRDPYIRLLLSPVVDNRKRETTIHRGQSHPYFDQNFKFPISRDQLPGKELILQVLDSDPYSHNDIMGEARINIDELDLSKSAEIWADFVRTKKPPEDRPELLVSLNYLPQAERLTIVIMKAKNLDTNQDPYVKIYLITNGKRVKKKKSSISKSNDPSNPVWNEAFTFNISQTNLSHAAIEIYVVTSKSEANAIGSCGIGPGEQGQGRQHWQDMTHNTRKPTALWHWLR